MVVTRQLTVAIVLFFPIMEANGYRQQFNQSLKYLILCSTETHTG